MKYLVLIAMLVVGCSGRHNGEAHERCYIPFKGLALVATDSRDEWVDPREVCELVASSIGKGPEEVRQRLFGASADNYTDPHCVCERSPVRL